MTAAQWWYVLPRARISVYAWVQGLISVITPTKTLDWSTCKDSLKTREMTGIAVGCLWEGRYLLPACRGEPLCAAHLGLARVPEAHTAAGHRPGQGPEKRCGQGSSTGTSYRNKEKIMIFMSQNYLSHFFSILYFCHFENCDNILFKQQTWVHR